MMPKSSLSKPGFALVCVFYEGLIHRELKAGGNYQVFRRLILKSHIPGLQKQAKIFLTTPG